MQEISICSGLAKLVRNVEIGIRAGSALYHNECIGWSRITMFIEQTGKYSVADPLQLRHGDDGCAEVSPAPF